MKDSYKVKQLQEMLEYEKAQPENEKCGHGKPINIDEGALELLIKYYGGKNNV